VTEQGAANFDSQFKNGILTRGILMDIPALKGSIIWNRVRDYPEDLDAGKEGAPEGRKRNVSSFAPVDGLWRTPKAPGTSKVSRTGMLLARDG